MLRERNSKEVLFMASQDRVWFVTGTSTGFGRILAEEVLKAGGKVVATARNVAQIADLEQQYPGRAKAIALDVTSKQQSEAAVAQAIEAFGRIDVLVNNAGYGLAGAVEEASDEEIKRQIDTNVYGVLYVTRAALPHLRKQCSGHILNLSSILGLTAMPGFSFYSLTKFAVEGLSEGLAAELAPLGIKVTLVEPGPFRTDFASRSAVFTSTEIDDYKQTAGKTREYLRTISGTQKGDPLRAVHALMEIVESTDPPLHLLLGSVAYTRYRGKLKQLDEELSKWEQVSLGADFPV